MTEFQNWILIVVLLVFGGAIVAIVRTKTKGWGRFSTSILLLTLVLFCATVALVLNKLEFPQFANLLFAVAGFAGALLTGKEEKEPPPPPDAAATR